MEDGNTTFALSLASVKTAFVVNEAEIQESVLLGDLNGDGKLTVTDVVLLRKAILQQG